MSSNFVGCSIGRSAGLTPLKMRSIQIENVHAVANESSGLSVFRGATLLGQSRSHGDHSITPSALSISGAGTVRLSSLAALRLIINSNFVGSSNGRLEGLAPFRILST